MAPPHTTAAAAAVFVFLLAAVVTMVPPAAARRGFVLPVSASHVHNLTAAEQKVIAAIDLCYERALNASGPAPVVEKFPRFEATLAKCLAEVDDKEFVPNVLAASKVASGVAAGVDSPDEKFAVYFARLTQVLTGSTDDEKKVYAGTKPDDATATAGTKPDDATAGAELASATAGEETASATAGEGKDAGGTA